MSDDDILKITEDDIQQTQDQSFPEKTGGIVIRSSDLQDTSSLPNKAVSQVPVEATSTKQSVDIVLLIDSSGSMAATDYAPDRLTAAKEAADVFTRRKVVQRYNDRVGVISFGGSPTTVHPLDSDLDSVAASLKKLVITHTGTMIGKALLAAKAELDRQGSTRRAIILLSDGGDRYDTSKPLQVASSMKGITIFTVGIGTAKGVKVRIPGIGEPVVCLNEKLLQDIARAAGGEYYHAPSPAQLQSIYERLADF